MSVDQLVAGIIVLAIAAAFVLDAILPEKPEPSRTRPGVPEPTWPDYLGETDLPHVPVARVVDVPALEHEHQVVTGEVIEAPVRRQLGAGR